MWHSIFLYRRIAETENRRQIDNPYSQAVRPDWINFSYSWKREELSGWSSVMTKTKTYPIPPKMTAIQKQPTHNRSLMEQR